MTKQSCAKFGLSAIVLGVVITSLLWVYSLTQFPSNPASTHQVDTFLHNATMEQFSVDGKLSKTTTVHFLKHYLKLGFSEFTSPTITLYSENTKPWKITALTGKSLQNNEIIELDGDVVAYQAASANTSSTTIKTSQLFYNVQTKLIYNNKLVTILRDQSVTQAQGLVFNIKTSILILKSHMSTHFTSTPKQQP